MTATIVVIAVAALFAVALAVRNARFVRVCAVCAAVSLTWAGMLAVNLGGRDTDPLLIAVLMGESVTGLMYAVEHRVPARFQVFRLPFLLTLTVAAYAAIGATGARTAGPYAALATLWAASIALYAGRRMPRVKGAVVRIIACCKNW